MRNLALIVAILISMIAVPAFADTAEENMDQAGEAMENAAENTGEAMEEAAEDMEEGAEEAAANTEEALDEAAANVEEATDDMAAETEEAANEIEEETEVEEEKGGCSSTGAGFGGTLAGTLLIGFAAARRRDS